MDRRGCPPRPAEEFTLMDSQSSFDDVMARLRAGDDAAAVAVFDRFARRLVRLAESRLEPWVRPHADAEDIVQSVYRSFFSRYAGGQFQVCNWNCLWGILLRITQRKCTNLRQRLRAQRRDVLREVLLEGPAGVGDTAARDPAPDEAAILADLLEDLMRPLEPGEREMLTLSLEGFSIREISERVGWSQRTVHRLLERVRRRLETHRAAVE